MLRFRDAVCGPPGITLIKELPAKVSFANHIHSFFLSCSTDGLCYCNELALEFVAALAGID